MNLAGIFEYVFVFLILIGCGAFIWRRFAGTLRGESTTCGCEQSCCQMGMGKSQGECPASEPEKNESIQV